MGTRTHTHEGHGGRDVQNVFEDPADEQQTTAMMTVTLVVALNVEVVTMWCMVTARHDLIAMTASYLAVGAVTSHGGC